MDDRQRADFHLFLCQVFACSQEIAASIGQRAGQKHYPESEILINQGDRTSTTFLLVAGRAHALANSAEGQSVLLHEFMPGDFFGAIAQTEPELQDADVVAIEHIHAALFLALDFIHLLETHGCVGLAVSRALIKQLRAAANRVMESVALSASGRVCAELLRMALRGDGRMVPPPLVLSALALRVQTTRETASRTVNNLIRRGIVRREGEGLAIVARQRLEDMII